MKQLMLAAVAVASTTFPHPLEGRELPLSPGYGTSPLKHICEGCTVGLKETHSNALLHNPRVQEEVTVEIGKHFVLDKNENRNKSKPVRMQLKEHSELVLLTWGTKSGILRK